MSERYLKVNDYTAGLEYLTEEQVKALIVNLREWLEQAGERRA